ncbi:sensor histidine kinase KdpD [Sphingomonas sp. G-3-2-10]|uniref:sensor histidine kinase n=1 Tax=Sphingomonas sp. G-3-2-10 TaxID=2728838 RepID=UPI00146D87A9|nr:sensor histidine kinase KdpD [Sphingomonas sp. G-3-2-10]NML06644.1 sensor histidine kinase KdpD [Sphingomonas sp. G-3-2-10]
MPPSDSRPSPDALLRAAARESRGKLKIFLGAAPGVGKTFEMLREGAERLRAGEDVVVAIVETHGRADTAALVEPFEVIARRTIDYQGHALEEMDIDAVLARRPALALVDEYAHTNVEGSRHPKRWQDVAELLDAGIGVYTTLNIQHVESLNDVVASFTRVRVRETVPDSVFDGAEIEVVDLPPDELIERLKDGKVYIPAEASRALGHFFSKPNLSALREMALRRAALSVDQALLEHLDASALPGTFAGGERVLVAVSELPGSDAIVRAAKRLADALRAPWQAVYIETPRAQAFGEAQKRQIADTLRLAASLGATIATVPAENVTEGLTRHLQGMRATQLVIGKSVRSWWFELRHGSVVNAMLRAGDGVAVHVIPAADSVVAPAARPVGQWAGPSAYLAIAALVAATTLIAKLVEPLIGLGGIDLVYLLPVILASGRFGLRPGLVAGLGSALAYNFFFLPPLYTFSVADPQAVLTVLVLIAIAAFTANLAGRLKARATLGARSAAENAAVAAFGQTLARVSDWEETSREVCNEIARVLDVGVVLLNEREGALTVVASCPPGAVLGPVDQAAAEWSGKRGEPAGAGTATLNAADWQFHPLKTALGILAVVGFSRDDGRDPVPAERAVLLSTLLGQAALAHERLTLEAQLREVTVLKERDALRAALLSSIGHDLRTPLTSVSGAIEELAAEYPRAVAIPVARSEVARLRRFLDNLIDMVRIDTGGLRLSPEPIDLTDAVAAAVHDLKDVLRDHEIDLQVPPDLPFVTADATLLHHILINLLANAAQHGGRGTPITISGTNAAGTVRLSVRDRGAGLPAGLEAQIFDTFAQGRGDDRHGGSGLGLAIVKAFATGMGLSVKASNHPSGGALFELDFPPFKASAA